MIEIEINTHDQVSCVREKKKKKNIEVFIQPYDVRFHSSIHMYTCTILWVYGYMYFFRSGPHVTTFFAPHATNILVSSRIYWRFEMGCVRLSKVLLSQVKAEAGVLFRSLLRLHVNSDHKHMCMVHASTVHMYMYMYTSFQRETHGFRAWMGLAGFSRTVLFVFCLYLFCICIWIWIWKIFLLPYTHL